MNELEIIDKYLIKIVDYYSQLKGTNNFILFLKREVQCIDECIDLIDLNLLPLSENYIIKCRCSQREALKRDDFLKISKSLSIEIVNTIFKVKKYTTMSKQERAVFDSFLCLFPRGVESSDLLIEVFTDAILDCDVKEEDFLPILYKNFKDILE